MVMAKVALARYATRQAAEEVAYRLRREGYDLRLIATPKQNRVIRGASMGWLAFSSHMPRTRLSIVFKNLFSKLHRSITSADLLGFGVPQEVLEEHPENPTVSDHIVIVTGSSGQ